MNYTLKTDTMTYTFAQKGAELCSARRFDGTEYVWQGDEKIWNEHSPVLFPLCGRLLGGKYTLDGKEYEMGCHGFFSSSEPELITESGSELVFRLTESEKTLAVFPFPFSLTLKYTVSGNELCVNAVIKNTGKDVLPFMYGAHPGINVPLESGLDFSDYSVYLGEKPLTLFREQNGPFVSPTSEPICFEGGVMALDRDKITSYGTMILSAPDCEIKLFSEKGERSVSMSYSEGFKYFCMWRSPAKRADYICLEPWSDVPSDGITPECFETRKNMQRLQPNEEKSFTYKVKFN